MLRKRSSSSAVQELLRGPLSIGSGTGAVSVANPLTQVNNFGIYATVSPSTKGHWLAIGGPWVLFSIGQFTTTNSLTVYYDDNRRLSINSKGGDGVARTYNANSVNGYLFTGPRKIGVFLPPSSPPIVTIDGVQTTLDNANNLVFSAQPSTIYVGGAQAVFPSSLIVESLRTPSDVGGSRTLFRPSATKRVVCLGDSITGGFGVGTPWPQGLETAMGSALKQADNYGVPGATVSGVTTVFNNAVRNRGYTHAAVMAGVNDLIAGTSAATIFTTLGALYDAIRAQGITLYPMTVAPFKNHASWTSGKQTQLEALNALIDGYCDTNSLTLIDTYTLLGDTDPAALKAAYDSGDGLHPNQTGASLIATTAEGVLDP